MSLQIYLGPMFAGKSTRAREKVTTLADIGLKSVYINHGDDKRNTEGSDKNITTHHSGFSKTSRKVDTISTYSLKSLDVTSWDVIGVDEFQFFEDEEDVDTVSYWVEELNKTVFIAALDGDAQRKIFGHTLKLIPMADKVVKMRAYCDHCKDRGKKIKSSFTAKLVPDGVQKDVGGKNKYITLCRKCYRKHSAKFNKK